MSFTDFVPKTRHSELAPESTLSDAVASLCGCSGEVDVIENDRVSYTYIVKDGNVVGRKFEHPIFRDRWQTYYF